MQALYATAESLKEHKDLKAKVGWPRKAVLTRGNLAPLTLAHRTFKKKLARAGVGLF